MYKVLTTLCCTTLFLVSSTVYADGGVGGALEGLYILIAFILGVPALIFGLILFVSNIKKFERISPDSSKKEKNKVYLSLVYSLILFVAGLLLVNYAT